ncbi:maoC like domain protein [Paraburkholderia xenovorans LB400]|uniref:Dehydratase n=1 Tax=Paraburkholderia xenovorans (strain LB400) TaxID=266265 RepID=Q13GS4_PARXL|nr:MaoC family dehydratase [Paraburkholderia xenovorans]ABE36715.1 Putative dehydratase [Paraburkholderia xenovorans LB400]AIP34019.1 maoC like domain protein [Paraburkholderia xenovorans LB400]
MTPNELKKFPIAGKGNFLEDFTPGRTFDHARGRTMTRADNVLYGALTVQLNPLYLDVTAAQALGHAEIPIHPYLVFATVLGLSVEDLSEKGGAFLGVDDLQFERPVYPGMTLRARSVVKAQRVSDSRPGFGIVTWMTEGHDASGERVVTFTRTNLVYMREPVNV